MKDEEKKIVSEETPEKIAPAEETAAAEEVKPTEAAEAATGDTAKEAVAEAAPEVKKKKKEKKQQEDDGEEHYMLTPAEKIKRFFKNWYEEKILARIRRFKDKHEKRKKKREAKKQLPKRTFKEKMAALGNWFKTLPKRIINWFKSLTKDQVKTFFFGSGEKKGFLVCFVSYALLILFGFVYIYPMLYMLGYSLMSPSDIANPMVNYVPTEWYGQNFSEASQVLNFWKTLGETLYVSVLPSLFQTVACGVTAYGLARFKFPGKKVLFALILITFIVPTQLTMLPQLLIYSNLKLTDTIFSFVIPAMFGQGIKSAVFILIFYQFFRGIPDSVVEAAKIDGANSFKIFYKIGIPAAMPAILLSFLLSVVWYYNETVLTSIYFGGTITTLPLELSKFQATYEQLFGTTSTTGKSVNEAIYMAGTLLSILPLLIIYFFTQRFFTEGIDKAGITGE